MITFPPETGLSQELTGPAGDVNRFFCIIQKLLFFCLICDFSESKIISITDPLVEAIWAIAMATPRRGEILRRPDVPRRRSVRQALASIPDSATFNVSPGNEIVHRYSLDSSTSTPSPDELVIQKRGRRKSIVWSPDIDAVKRESLFRDKTPVKSPAKNLFNTSLRSTPRKRLHLDDPTDVEMVTPEKKEKLMTPKELPENLANRLRSLSHEQLVKLVMDLVSMQEDNALSVNDKLRDVILKTMPVPEFFPPSMNQ